MTHLNPTEFSKAVQVLMALIRRIEPILERSQGCLHIDWQRRETCDEIIEAVLRELDKPGAYEQVSAYLDELFPEQVRANRPEPSLR